jgi:Serine kinase of the HPr protein, regulates carbohydrate metabolism
MDNAQQHKTKQQHDSLAAEITSTKVTSIQGSMAHHGIALEIFGRGVVIVGKSGIGKSELGLELVDRGHRLICDDLVEGQLIDDHYYYPFTGKNLL